MEKENEKKLMRGLDAIYLERFEKSKWFEFYKKHQEELFLGIRNNYINIYYKGMNIAKVRGRFNNASISDRYRYKNFEGESKTHAISYEEFEKNYEKIIKPEVKKHIEKNTLWEKETQQELILKNNKACKNAESDWVCIDMEYIKQRKDIDANDKKSFGRFDIIAVNKKNYKVALIELKVGSGAISGGSGLLKHAKDWQEFEKRGLFFNDIEEGGKNYLKQEIINIINNKFYLDNEYPIKGCTENDFKNIKPSYYFLICSGDITINEVKNEVRKYLWSEEKCSKYNIRKVSEEYNIEKSEEIGYDISEKGAGPLYCEFLFAEGSRENVDITDIIDDDKYDTDIKK